VAHRHAGFPGWLGVYKLSAKRSFGGRNEANQRNDFEPANLLLLSLFGGYWLSGGGPATSELYFRYPVPFLERFIAYNLTPFETATDPIDDLSRWPVPNELAHYVIKENSNGEPSGFRSTPQKLGAVSVLNLMTVIQGGPLVISHSPEVPLEVALLGAAHIVRDTESDALLGMPGFASPGGAISSDRVTLHRRRVNSIAGVALGWFVEQLPQRAFPERLEKMIGETKDRSYND
jgi:hypothetical protein